MKRYLIFTDLDGTLLDHENYSFGTNKKMISTIINNKNEIIFNTSKTKKTNGAFLFFTKK